MRIDAERVLRRRRDQQQELIDRAREVVGRLDPALGVRGAVVFGSTARGDFNLWSDVDLLVVADRADADAVGRMAALGRRSDVQVIAWTPPEASRQRARGNPIVAEAAGTGVWLVGDATVLDA